MTTLMIELGDMIGSKVKFLSGETTRRLEWTLALIQQRGATTGIVDKIFKYSLDKLMSLCLALANKMNTLVDHLLGQELIMIDRAGMTVMIEIP